jgi:hypothetical protein
LKMVNRVESAGKLEEFEAIVESIELEIGMEERRQYHIIMNPTSVKVGGATGRLHEWIPVSAKATEEAVPQGSVMDRYLTQVEICVAGAKGAKTIKEELNMMKGKKFRFKKLKLGRDFNGQSAKEYAVPVVLL